MESDSLTTMNGSAEARMRDYLGAIESGKGGGKLPELLLRAARRSVLGTPAAQDLGAIEDIASAVLEQIFRRDEATALALLPGKKLRAALGQRCRQAAAELWPRWQLRKQLREHVVAALDAFGAGPVEQASMPLDLIADGRFCGAHVRTAVCALLTAPLPARRHATQLTAALMKTYFPPEAALDQIVEPKGPGEPDEALLTALDAPRIAARLHRMLGRDLSRILSMFLLGRTLREIAAAVGLAIATVHARVKECERRLRAYRERVAASIELMRAALLQFAVQA